VSQPSVSKTRVIHTTKPKTSSERWGKAQNAITLSAVRASKLKGGESFAPVGAMIGWARDPICSSAERGL